MGDLEGGLPVNVACSVEDKRRVANEIAPVNVCARMDEALTLIKSGDYDAAYKKLGGIFFEAEKKFAVLKQANPNLSVYDWYAQMLGKDFLKLYFYIPEEVLQATVDAIPITLSTYVMSEEQTLNDKVDMMATAVIRFLSLLRSESAYDPKALYQKKEKGKVVFEAIGIGQLARDTAEEMIIDMVRFGGYTEEWAAKHSLWNMSDNIAISFYYFSLLLEQFGGPLYVTLGGDNTAKAEIAYKYGHNGIRHIWEDTCKFDTTCFFGKVKYAEERTERLGQLNYWHTMLYRDRIVRMIKKKYYPELLEAPKQPAATWLQHLFVLPQQ
ncbi:MAG: hypothetical protein NT099_07365 [Candidatus Saganbacteria bacterium]|nr:hypothetical protein [Candidatus Saganbacteria bacterium]